MADEHLYIHLKEDKEKKPTTPKIDEKETKPDAEDVIGGVEKAIGVAQNPVGSALGAVSKAIPYVAAAIFATALVDKAIGTANTFIEGYTGNHSFGIAYRNFHTQMKNLMNPFGYAISALTEQMENYQANKQIEQNQILTGNSITNTYGGRNV